ncbi:hypothetical protein [Tardiphaga robiniae]|uniref:hypothetical protein n=1 Tax=Tardiphaga TaxID=1395974 RepID=UPI00285B8042|nr:hypothetical protein [Tardiphaga robiniae]MDR6663287.1 hypothetical protein [Tardiphaga robiniae]
MGLASYYEVIASGSSWGVLHDGNVEGTFETKEAAFEPTVSAASLAIRQGHEVRVTAPSRDAGNKTTLGGETN